MPPAPPSTNLPQRAPRLSHCRRGVTLVELLVVILLLGITAALVLPALTPPSAQRTDAASALLTRARRAAIRRGESLRLRVAPDGVWALVVASGAVELERGRLPVDPRAPDAVGAGTATTETTDAFAAEATPRLDVTIDALGSCRPASRAATNTGFDPLNCAWLPTRAGRVAAGDAPSAR